MKNFHCECGQRVFFDTVTCVRCGAELGFDPQLLDIVPVTQTYRRCGNGIEHGICNWLIPAASPATYCFACDLNEVIPNLDAPDNLRLWGRLETAKRRLLFNLLSLGLPFRPEEGRPGLRFRFMEDRRRNPDMLEDFVATGHMAGTITVNLAEADDVHRTAEREAMLERTRTLLGHFRHESGHYYFGLLVPEGTVRNDFRVVFGDERGDYEAALQAYYRDGPPVDWAGGFVSPYAAAHPHEDWAETFAHYLHIRDALETAHLAGMANIPGNGSPDWVLEWMRLSVTLNELNRSLGTDDPYPFVLSDSVIDKLQFLDNLISR